jgi:hypothetical protein
MTLQNLNKILDKYESQLGSTDTQKFELLKGLPIYDWSEKAQNTFTFNHVIGLPQKNGVNYPLFDYEELVFNALQEYRHLWIKKATRLGSLPKIAVPRSLRSTLPSAVYVRYTSQLLHDAHCIRIY